MFGELQITSEDKMPEGDTAGQVAKAVLWRALLTLKHLKKELRFCPVCEYTNYQHHYKQGESFKSFKL